VVLGFVVSLALLMTSATLNTLLWALVVGSLQPGGSFRPRALARHGDGGHLRVQERVTVTAFLQSQETDAVRTILIDHFQERKEQVTMGHRTRLPSVGFILRLCGVVKLDLSSRASTDSKCNVATGPMLLHTAFAGNRTAI
jgi:hypothetical protein